MDITTRQREVLVRLLGYGAEWGFMPSVRQFQEHMGWASSYAAQRWLGLFRSRGWITEPNGFRGAYAATLRGRRAAK